MDEEIIEAQLDAEFEKLGDITPLPEFNFPDPSRLPYQGYDIIQRFTGVDLQNDEDTLGAKAAANEWFWRRLDGQKVSFAEVYARGNVSGVQVGPTQAATPPPTPNG
jgi:hypothetical protein